MPVIEDSDLLATAALAFSAIALIALSRIADEARYLIPAGVVAFLLAFQLYDLTGSLPVALAVVTVGILLLVIPIARPLET